MSGTLQDLETKEYGLCMKVMHEGLPSGWCLDVNPIERHSPCPQELPSLMGKIMEFNHKSSIPLAAETQGSELVIFATKGQVSWKMLVEEACLGF